VFNFFGLTIDQLKIEYSGSHELRNHFSVFFIGSQVALACHLITKCEYAMDLIRKEWAQKSFNLISLFIGLLGLGKHWWLLYRENDFAYRSRAALYWSGALFFTLLSQPNAISNFFGSSQFLKSLGKYSFSFYLLHMGVRTSVKKLKLESDLDLVAVTIGSTYVISFFAFYLIENPLIRLANRLCARLDDCAWFFESGETKLINEGDVGFKYVKLNAQSIP
jgi:peptidoglycan/LPS O-acetylase OafA/YrhL